MSDRFLQRLGAASGLAFVLLAILGNDVIVGSGGPEGTASRREITSYLLANPPTMRSWAGLYVELLGLLAFVVFVACLWSVLRSAEGERGYLSATVFGAGLLSVGVKLASLPAAAAAWYRAEDGFDPQLATALLDMNGISFVITWAIDAVMLAAVAAIVLRHGGLPRWLGWSALVLSPALLVSVAAVTAFPPFPFLLTLLWFVAASIALVRRAGVSAAPSAAAAATPA